MRSSTTETNRTHPDQNAPNKPQNPTETSPPLSHTREVSNVVWSSHGPLKPFRPRKASISFGVKPLPFFFERYMSQKVLMVMMIIISIVLMVLDKHLGLIVVMS